MTPAEAARILAGAQANPIEWARGALGFDPWGAQARGMESVRDNRKTAIRSCHGIGKSTLAAVVVLWFLSTRPRSLILTTATSGRQVQGILWREIAKLVRTARQPIGGHLTTTRLEIDKDWWAWGFTSREYDADRFQGFHADHVLVVVDEAAGVGSAVFEGLDSTMATGHARMLMIGNATDGSGEFGKAFKSSAVNGIAVDAFSTPNFTEYGITVDDIRQGSKMDSGPWKDKVTGVLPRPYLISPTWVREKWLEWCGGSIAGENDPRWLGRVKAEFPEDAANALFPTAWIDEAVERWKEIEASADGWPKLCRLGVDVARFGGDAIEVADFRPGAGVRSTTTLPKATITDTARNVETHAIGLSQRGTTVDAVRVDADGLGAGVYDYLRERSRFTTDEVRSGMAASDPSRYANRRAEWAWRLREMLDPTGTDPPIALPPDPELHRQLQAFRWSEDKRGRKVVEAKDEIKARLGRSPDTADAVIYACAPHVGKEASAFLV